MGSLTGDVMGYTVSLSKIENIVQNASEVIDKPRAPVAARGTHRGYWKAQLAVLSTTLCATPVPIAQCLRGY